MAEYPARPPTPQAMVHRLPDKPDTPSTSASTKPDRFVILIEASAAVAGKVQVAQSVSRTLACPLFQGDSLHETAARAASVGASINPSPYSDGIGFNEARYQRMWLSKMTRTGLLFPEESRPAGSGFAGFGGSASTSRRGSNSSEVSLSSFSVRSDTLSTADVSVAESRSDKSTRHVNRPPAAAYGSADMGSRREDSALLVLTHPQLDSQHKDCIRKAIAEYRIGVIFVPLEADADLPVLQPLDPRNMTSFGVFSFGTSRRAARDWDEEIVLTVDVGAKLDDLAQEIVDGVRAIMDE